MEVKLKEEEIEIPCESPRDLPSAPAPSAPSALKSVACEAEVRDDLQTVEVDDLVEVWYRHAEPVEKAEPSGPERAQHAQREDVKFKEETGDPGGPNGAVGQGIVVSVTNVFSWEDEAEVDEVVVMILGC